MKIVVNSGILFGTVLSIIHASTAYSEQILSTQNNAYSDVESSLDTVFENEYQLTLAQLSKQRGGFISPDGFKISIGFEQITAINGELKTISKFNVPSLDLRDPVNLSKIESYSLTIDSIREAIEQYDYTIPGNLTPGQLDELTDQLDTITGTLTDSSNPDLIPNTIDLITRINNGDAQHTDDILSMLSLEQNMINLPGDSLNNSEFNSPVPFPPNLIENMSSFIMNTTDNALIQSIQVLNVKVDNMGEYRNKSLNALLLPQIIQSLHY